MASLQDVLMLQQKEMEQKLREEYVERDLGKSRFGNDLIKVIMGPRRSGKSFAAIHTLGKIGSFGYVNFDDERLTEIKNYDEVIDALKSIYNNPRYLLLDEIQNLDKWELFANRLQRQGYNLIVTGSNAHLLGKELATHLTGRHLPIILFPFSFTEVVGLEKTRLTQSETREKFLSYLKKGGYPEPLIKNVEHGDYISALFYSIIYKDIVKRFKIRAPQMVENLAKYLLSNISREFSFSTLAQVTQSKSSMTVEKYLKYLEEAFIFFRLDRFSFKVKGQITSGKKIYCFDNGFVSVLSFAPNIDLGKLYENEIAIELKKREMQRNERFYYWKNPQGEEVDFLLTEGNKVKQLIQVCYSLEDPKTKQREIRALLKAGNELKCSDLLIITDNYEAETQEEWFGIKAKVKYVPAYKWLLQNPQE